MRYSIRVAGMASMISILLAIVASAAVGGEALRPPVNLPPLAENWREAIYANMTQKMSKSTLQVTRLFFLGEPVPCTLRRLGWKAKVDQGYGGWVGYRQRAFIGTPTYTLWFYLADANGGIIFDAPMESLAKAEVAPELFVSSTSYGTRTRVGPGGKPSVGGTSSTTLTARIREPYGTRWEEFKKAKTPLEQLPPYQ